MLKFVKLKKMKEDEFFGKIGLPIIAVILIGWMVLIEHQPYHPMVLLSNAVAGLENRYSSPDALPSTSKQLLPRIEQTESLLKRLGAHKDKLEGRMEFLLLYKENKPLKKAQTKRKGTGKNNQLRTGL